MTAPTIPPVPPVSAGATGPTTSSLPPGFVQNISVMCGPNGEDGTGGRALTVEDQAASVEDRERTLKLGGTRPRVTANENGPLAEASSLRKLAREYAAESEDDDDERLSAQMFVASKQGRAMLWQVEAEALERGYRLGRVMAAADVRLGLDAPFANGGVHFDSDVESPPLWLMTAAERLARGDA